jgi:spore coat protein U-like protein
MLRVGVHPFVEFTLNKRILIAGLAAAFALAPATAPAGTLTSNMTVGGTILAGCTAFTAPAVSFGVTINPGASNVHPAAIPTLSMTCANGISATITLNGGLNAVANVRQLKNGTSNFIPYSIDQLAYGGSTPWGDNGTTITGTGVAQTGTGSALAVSVFPYIPSVTLLTPPGAYTDTVVATISF